MVRMYFGASELIVEAQEQQTGATQFALVDFNIDNSGGAVGAGGGNNKSLVTNNSSFSGASISSQAPPLPPLSVGDALSSSSSLQRSGQWSVAASTASMRSGSVELFSPDGGSAYSSRGSIDLDYAGQH
jgi:hypothetical protein